MASTLQPKVHILRLPCSWDKDMCLQFCQLDIPGPDRVELYPGKKISSYVWQALGLGMWLRGLVLYAGRIHAANYSVCALWQQHQYHNRTVLQ